MSHPHASDMLSHIGQMLNLSGKTLLYPCCGQDTSPAGLFQPTFLDSDQEAIKQLLIKGLHAVCTRIENYYPEKKFEIIFLYDYVAGPDDALRHLEEQGIVILNDYHGDASRLSNNPRYKLIGAADYIDEKSIYFGPSDLEGYFSPYDTWNEFKQDNPDEYVEIITIAKTMLTLFGQDMPDSDDEILDKYNEFGIDPFYLPFKRSAELYIFQKQAVYQID